jgi:hypothetical protein
MITVKINNQNIDVYSFDDFQAVLKRYVILYPDNKYNTPTLPSYLIFDNFITKFSSNKNYTTQDVRDTTSTYDIQNITDIQNLTNLEQKFKLTKIDIVNIWLLEKGYSSGSRLHFEKLFTLQNFGSYLRFVDDKFKNAGTTYESVTSYNKYVTNTIKFLQRSTERENNVFGTLEKVGIIETGPFEIEDTVEDTFLTLQNEESLYDIFDTFTVSEYIPFIALFDGKKNFYKVYSELSPPDNWILFSPLEKNVSKCIYFRVLNTSTKSIRNVSKSTFDYEKVYSEGFWYEENMVKLLLKIGNEVSPQILRDRIFNSLKGKILYTIKNTVQSSVKGKFSLPNEEFNKAVLADLIANNEIFSYFLFVDERKMSAIEKNRFIFYYEPNHSFTTDNAFTITMTPVKSGGIKKTESKDSEKWINVRMARTKDMSQVRNFIGIFQKLFGIYKKLESSVKKQYEELYPKINFTKYSKSQDTEKINRKTGRRLLALINHNPEAFGNDYAEKCSPKAKQPYLIKSSDLENVRELMQKGKPNIHNFDKHGVINWPTSSDDWYSCYPRESGDTDEDHIWAGLLLQKKTAVNYDSYKFLPCCFKENQYTKNSTLSVYISGKADNFGEDKDGSDIVLFDRPLGSKKLTPRGKFAELPYYLKIVGILSGYSVGGTPQNSTLYRHGVARGPDSFVHCLVKIFDENYDSQNLENKRKIVGKTLKKLSGYNDSYFTITKQEMYDYEYSEIKSHLSTKGAYIDPDMYINLFSKHYNCNIVLVKVDEFSEDGDIVIPRHAIVHLPYKISTKKVDTVIIVKFRTIDPWQYQCELVVKYTDGKVEYIFRDIFAENIMKIVEAVNKVYTTSPEGEYIEYTPYVSI